MIFIRIFFYLNNDEKNIRLPYLFHPNDSAWQMCKSVYEDDLLKTIQAFILRK